MPASQPVNVAKGLIAFDAFGTFFKAIFLMAAALTLLLSVRYLDTEGTRHGEYTFLVLCATLGMMFMAGGTDLITIFVGLETMAIAFYILTGLLKPDRRSNEAAVKYFLLGTFSLGLLLYGLSILYGLSGTTNLRSIAVVLAGHGRDPWLVLAVIFVVAGIGFKIAAVPFHMWAPDVYEGAPTPITAFLSVGSKAASFAMLLRIFREALPSVSGDWTILFYVLSVVTMTVGNIGALTQSNTKRMLAYSSIAHAGLPADRRRCGDDARRGGDDHLPPDLRADADGRLRRRDPAAPRRRHRRRTEGPERAPVQAALRRRRDAVLHAVARRHSADRGVHGEVLDLQRGDRRRLRLAGGHRRDQQRHLPLLLPAHRRLHVHEGRSRRVRGP